MDKKRQNYIKNLLDPNNRKWAEDDILNIVSDFY